MPRRSPRNGPSPTKDANNSRRLENEGNEILKHESSSSSSMSKVSTEMAVKLEQAGGVHGPPAISFLTGKECKVPQGWSTSQGGTFAAVYANKFARSKQADKKNRKNNGTGPSNSSGKPSFQCANDLYWLCFRLAGSTTLVFQGSTKMLNGGTIDPNKNKRWQKNVEEKKDTHLWDVKTGEPLHWNDDVSLNLLYNAVDSGKIKLLDDQVKLEFLKMCVVYQHPATSRWKSPFVCPRVTVLTQEKSSARGSESVMSIRVDVYLNRLIFYLIADDGLKTLLDPLTPGGEVVGKITPIPPAQPMFSKSFDEDAGNTNKFSVASILRSQENCGYKPYSKQPDGIQLKLRDYQLQTLQWLVDQEALPRGLNGYFWEKRSWKSDRQDSHDDCFFYSSVLGELRLDDSMKGRKSGAPPLVRGGLICQEMGLGKTLMFLSLILAQRGKLELPYEVSEDHMFSRSSLIVVPNVLVSQWQREIQLSLEPDMLAQLNVLTVLMSSSKDNRFELKNLNGDVVGSYRVRHYGQRDANEDNVLEMISNSDIVITTYNTIKKLKLLQAIHWRRVALDEMQEIRSATTELSRILRNNFHARSRWMISGTPIFSNLSDLNSELAFLGVYPFCLPDSVDGFWGLRIQKPFERTNPSALQYLRILLDRCMIRHSKKQTYIDRPNMNILELPPFMKKHIGIPLTLEEEACYAYLEVLTKRALEVGVRNAHMFPAHLNHLKLGQVGIGFLRLFTLSPNLINGGNGAHTVLELVNNFARNTLAMVASASAANRGNDDNNGQGNNNDGCNEEEDALLGMTKASFQSMPMDRLRDYFLTRQDTGNNNNNNNTSSSSSSTATSRRAYAVTKSGGKGAAGSASLEHAQIRLDSTREKLEAAEKQVKAKLCSRKGGSLPKLRWKWVLQAVTSGKYQCILMIKRQVQKEHRFETPLLWARACQVYLMVKNVCNRQLELRSLGTDMESYSVTKLCKTAEQVNPEFTYWFEEEERHVQEEGGYLELKLVESCYFKLGSGAAPTRFHDDPSRWKRFIIEEVILKQDPRFVEIQNSLNTAQEEFDSKLPEGIASHVLIQPFVCGLKSLKFQARLETLGEHDDSFVRGWYPVELCSVDHVSGLCLVEFLDGERRYVSNNHVKPREEMDGMEDCEKIEDITLGKIARDMKLPDDLVQQLEPINVLDVEQMDTILKEMDDTAERRTDRVKEHAYKLILDKMIRSRLHENPATCKKLRSMLIEGKIARATELVSACEFRDDVRTKHALIGAVQHFHGFEPKTKKGKGSGSKRRKLDLEEVDYDKVAFFLQLKGKPAKSSTIPFTQTLIAKADKLYEELDELMKEYPEKAKLLENYERSGEYQGHTKELSVARDCVDNMRMVQVSRLDHSVERVLVQSFNEEFVSVFLDGQVKPLPWNDVKLCVTLLGNKNKNKTKKAVVKSKKRSKDYHEQNEDQDKQEDDDEEEVVEEEEEEEEDNDDEERGGKVDLHLGLKPKKGISWTVQGKRSHQSIQARKEAILVLESKIHLAEQAVESLGTYSRLLERSIVNQAANVGVVEQQGFQALQQMIDHEEQHGDKKQKKKVIVVGDKDEEEDDDDGYPVKCAICLDSIKEPVCTVCIHLFCKDCLCKHIDAANHMNFHRGIGIEDKFSCPLCRKKLTASDVFRALKPENASAALEVDDDGDAQMIEEQVAKMMAEMNDRKDVVISESLKDMVWFPSVDGRTANLVLQEALQAIDPTVHAYLVQTVGLEALNSGFLKVLSSLCGMQAREKAKVESMDHLGSKMKRVIADLKESLGKDGKIVVFSQHREALMHLKCLLDHPSNNIPHQTIMQGDQQAKLEEAVRDFNQNPKYQVLLIQSSTGAAGLTLTVANQVMILEPMQKVQEEIQAINRVYRIGQQRAVEVRLYYARRTVEERLLAWRNKEHEENKDDMDNALTALVDGSKSAQNQDFLHFVVGLPPREDDGEESYVAGEFLSSVSGSGSDSDDDSSSSSGASLNDDGYWV